jgi:hypothetical protein
MSVQLSQNINANYILNFQFEKNSDTQSFIILPIPEPTARQEFPHISINISNISKA